MRIVTKQVIANVQASSNPAPGSDPAAIQKSTGALSAAPVGAGGWWLFTYETPLEALDGAYWITETAKLESTPVFEKVGFSRQASPRLTPNDPLYANQWHLNSTTHGINVTTAWDTRQGTGRHIAVIDDGLQLAHPDLTANTYSVASGNNYDFTGDDTDPTPGVGDDHGTACGGLAAGRGNNSLGVTGVAFMAKLLGLRLIAGPFSEVDEQQAFNWMPLLTDVSTNSWGPSDDGATLRGPGPVALAGLQSAVTTGRGGRGVIFTWAGGNGRARGDNSNYDGYANSRFVVNVGASACPVKDTSSSR